MKRAKPEPEYRRAGAGGIDSPQASPEGSGAGEHPDQIVTRNGKPVSVILPNQGLPGVAGASRRRRRCGVAEENANEAAPLSAARTCARRSREGVTSFRGAQAASLLVGKPGLALSHCVTAAASRNELCFEI